MATHVRVIVGNPPYSVGQKSANDNAQNLSYPNLEKRIASTYIQRITDKNSTVQALYDSYVKAFRWASDRIPQNEGGVVAFISNGAWLDGNAQNGMRRCFEEEFTSIYVLNLRGNQRTSGELSRKEGGKIFGSGSRTPIAITFLVKNPAKKGQKAVIHYHDIGDYLTREQKLKMTKEFRSISSRKLDWQIIMPNEKADWINQRDGVFDNLILLGDKKNSKQTVFSIFSAGDITHRDVWCYNSSTKSLSMQMQTAITTFNQEASKCVEAKTISEIATLVNADPTQIKWDQKLFEHALKGIRHTFDNNKIRLTLYRPYFKQWLYYDKAFNWSQYQLPKLFPTPTTENLLICLSGVGNKNFSCLITNEIPDYQIQFNSQCFPLYWYEENKNPQASLFDDAETNRYIRRDGITDWILKEVRNRFGGLRAITKEHIFYYVYGLLHSKQYRERFADDLKKSLPRIPIVDNVQDFMAFYKAGKELADLHLNYEQGINEQITGQDGDYPFYANMPMVAHRSLGIKVIGDIDIWNSKWTDETYQYFAVEKMHFAKVRNKNGKLIADKKSIIYNGHIIIENIPLKAYEYIVNGKSAIDWIMERYAVTIDKASQIKNDPNDWSQEHEQPRYILDLLLSVIMLSCQTVDIVNTLPKLNF